jgi:hypothetical protein
MRLKMNNFFKLLLIFLAVFAFNNALAQSENFTQIRVVTPFGYPGENPNADIKITQTLTGSCWTASIVNPRADAWRCSVGNQILDPCFSNLSDNKAVCMKMPWENSGILLNLSKTLPKRSGRSENFWQKDPWAIELTNGIRCVNDHSGTLSIYAGMTSGSTCFDANGKVISTVYVNNIDRSQPFWRIFIRSNDMLLEQVAVKSVWY